MKLSLRRRLVLTLAVAVAIVLGAVAIASKSATQHEFGSFLDRELSQFVDAPPDLEPYRARLTAHWLARGTWSGSEGLLREIERDLGGNFNLMLAELPGASKGGFDQKRTERASPGEEPGHVVIFDDSLPNSAATSFEMPELTLYDVGGVAVGRLLAVPNLTSSGKDMQARFAGSLNQWIVFTALAAGLLGFVLISWVAKRIVGPIEAMTAATLSMAEGDLSQRIEVRPGDELGSLALAFNTMAASLERSQKALRNMVGDVAHELRTPLTNTRCQIEALQDGLVPLDANALDSLHHDTLHLGKLVDDLQELSLADAGALHVEAQTLDLREAVERCLARIPKTAHQAHLRSMVAPLAPVLADPMRLQQILTNLIANALANTPANGTITIEAHERASHIEVAVCDTGHGIAASDLPHIFERLYRTDPSRTRATGGAGLGLAIVKQLVELQGGTVGAESSVGAGTRVWFTLRAAGAHA